MNKEALTALVAEILGEMADPPMVKGGEYHATQPEPAQTPIPHQDGDFVEDVSELDLRRLYLVEQPADGDAFRRMKAKTPARLGAGRAGPRYKTLTMLRFRADHAAAQDAVFSQVPENYAKENGLIPVQTRCKDKDQYLTRPDLGRRFDDETAEKIRAALPHAPKIQVVIGDGLSSAAILANAMDCLQAIQAGLKTMGIDLGPTLFVRYCRVGAGDAVGSITECDLVCVLVGERPGLVTAQSMSAYITYKPRIGALESSRTVISNIHAQGTPAVEAGAHIAQLMQTILQKKVSGVALNLEAGA